MCYKLHLDDLKIVEKVWDTTFHQQVHRTTTLSDDYNHPVW